MMIAQWAALGSVGPCDVQIATGDSLFPMSFIGETCRVISGTMPKDVSLPKPHTRSAPYCAVRIVARQPSLGLEGK